MEEKDHIERPRETTPDPSPDDAARLFEPPKIERTDGKLDESYALLLDDEEGSDVLDEDEDEDEE